MRKKYFPSTVKNMTVKQLRQALGKQNKAARESFRRLQRDIGRQPDYVKIIPVKQLTKKADLQKQLVDINRFLRSYESKSSKAKTAENKRIRTLNERFGRKDESGKVTEGIVNKSNIVKFGDFMGWISEVHGEIKVGSPTAVAMWQAIQKQNVDLDLFKKTFQKFLNVAEDRRVKYKEDVAERRLRSLLDAVDMRNRTEILTPESQKLREKMFRKGILW